MLAERTLGENYSQSNFGMIGSALEKDIFPPYTFSRGYDLCLANTTR
jgi:hypothetical protein